MTSTQQSVQAELEALRARFLTRLPAMSAAIAQHWAHFSNDKSASARSELIDHAHKLAGAAGIFGLHELSRQGSTIEDVLLYPKSDGGGDDLRTLERAVARIIALTGDYEQKSE